MENDKGQLVCNSSVMTVFGASLNTWINDIILNEPTGDTGRESRNVIESKSVSRRVSVEDANERLPNVEY